MAGSHSTGKAVCATGPAPAISSANAAKGPSNAEVADLSPRNCPKMAISPPLLPRVAAPLAPSHVRRWTVGYRHPYLRTVRRWRPEPPPMPFLPLQGRWLHRAGFAIGTRVRVLVTPGRLVLEVDDTEGNPEIAGPGI
jgi:hypothetical protein